MAEKAGHRPQVARFFRRETRHLRQATRLLRKVSVPAEKKRGLQREVTRHLRE